MTWDDPIARLHEQIARAICRVFERHRALHPDDTPPDLPAAEQGDAVTRTRARLD